MPIAKLATLSFALIAALGAAAVFAQDTAVVVDPAIAGMTADQKVKARQAAMKEDGRLLKGASKASGADAVKIATAVLQNMTNFPALFAGGATTDQSEALLVIWTEFDQFSALFAKGQDASKAMLTAAQSGDTAGYQASIKALGGLCGQCHDKYREDTD